MKDKQFKSVLIIGNGESRKDKECVEFIQNWKHEIWGCNSIYIEAKEGSIPRLDVLTGDRKALIPASEYKQKFNLTYRMYTRRTVEKGMRIPGVKPLKVPLRYTMDSGSTLVAKAIVDGYDEIFCVGFDLGGKDIYVKGHENRNKSRWIRNWRKIANELGLDNVHFVGKDHLPYILSNESDEKYAKMYLRGLNHLSYDVKGDVKWFDKVLILGNGKSREEDKKFIDMWDSEIWVCNWAYQEYSKLPRLDRVGTVHDEVALKALEFKKEYNAKYEIYCKDVIVGYENDLKPFKERRGWVTGCLMLLQALIEEYDEIYLSGFDFGGYDTYQKKDFQPSNAIKQFKAVGREFGLDNVRFVGKTPEFIV